MINVEKEVLDAINKRHGMDIKSLDEEIKIFSKWSNLEFEITVKYNLATLLTDDEYKIIKPKLVVDWDKVPIDAKVVVTNAHEEQYNRYFAKNQNGVIYCWRNGRTSFTANDKISSLNKHELHESEIERGIEEGWCKWDN